MVKVATFFEVFASVATSINLTFISFERLYSIVFPLRHRRDNTKKLVISVLIIVWSFALVTASLHMMLWNWIWQVAVTTTVAIFIPVLVIITSYAIIFVKVKRTSQSVISQQDNNRIGRTLIIITCLYVLLSLPYAIVSVFVTYNEHVHLMLVDNLWIRFLIKWVHYANSCCNPIVYAIWNNQYKDGFKQALCRIWGLCANREINGLNGGEYSRRMDQSTDKARKCHVNRVVKQNDEQEYLVTVVSTETRFKTSCQATSPLTHPIYPETHRDSQLPNVYGEESVQSYV